MAARGVGGVWLLTARRLAGGRPLAGVVEAALAGGVAGVQLREPDTLAGELLALAEGLLALCRRAGVPLVINDRVDVALAVGADGVHLGGRSLPVADARRLLGRERLIGRSVHGLEEAREAAAAGADYLIYGHVFATPSKEGLAPRGTAALAEVCRGVAAEPVPVLAIGGVTAARLGEVAAAGAAGAAVMSGIMAAPDPGLAARGLAAAWDAARGEGERGGGRARGGERGGPGRGSRVDGREPAGGAGAPS